MMGKIDTVTKDYMRNTVVFADLFNYVLYGGRQMINPERLHELDSTELALPFGEDGGVVPVQRFRDVLKSLSAKTDETAAYLVLGAELESKVNYAMPVKNMLYDALHYAGQISESARSRRALKKAVKVQKMKDENDTYAEVAAALAVTEEESAKVRMTSDEFLSGLTKEDRLLPVVTVVVQFTPNEWDGALNLHSLLSVEHPEILSFIPDYRLNLISPQAMTDEEINKFRSSLREVLLYIKYSKDKKKLKEMIHTDQHFRTMEKSAVEVLKALTKTNVKIDESEDEVDMCQAIDEMLEEERKAGIETGMKTGIETGMKNGIKTGIKTGTERVNLLNQKLISDKRFEDLQKATVMPEYQHTLMLEYGIMTE